MRRRLIASFIVMAVLLVPALALSLPRPPTQSTVQETALVWPGGATSAQILASDSVGKITPKLQAGRSFRVEVTGTWTPGSSSVADAACESTNGGPWSHTGKGLVIRTTNFGAVGRPEACQPSSHLYNFTFTGNGTDEIIRINDNTAYGDNTGSLTVKIWAQNIVTYTFTVQHDIDPADLGLPGQVDATVPPVTVQQVGGQTIPPVPINPLPIPAIGSVGTYNSSQSGSPVICLKATVGGVTVNPVACAANPGGLIQGTGDIPIGGSGVGGGTICGSPPCVVPSVGPTTIGGQRLTQTIPAGSSVVLSFVWTGDRSHLYYTPLDDGAGNRFVAPFNPISAAERDWFATNYANVGAYLSATIKAPDGSTIYNGQVSPRIPGLGQILEAMFESQLGGS